MAQPPGIHARRAALQMLDAVLRRGETLEQAEGPALKQVRSAPDKALARAIANEVLRWLTDLDALIDSVTRQRLPDNAKARAVLRLMLVQWLRFDTPPHAVVATGLPLLSGGPRRLAHGVFSTLSKQAVALPEVPTLPEAVALRWGEMASEIAPGLADPPPLDLVLRDFQHDPEHTAQWAVKLGGESYLPGHVRLSRGATVEKIEGFREGVWWVQDLAASLPARLLGEGKSRHALDLCAAPGGKTMQLAASGWKVTALDLSKRRLDLLKDNLKRTGLKASPIRADALAWEPKHQFDAILLDAPCTATGTCRRHPDVLHRIGERQIEEMTELQAALLERAAGWLKPSGVLVYAVCSLEREEGEDQAARVALEPLLIAADELPAGIVPSPEGWLRTHPGMLAEHGGLDGFFVARWIKR
ncbi:RsmB/NOP family class I SAM-dependent RNA methyltransferase [Altererythrobacter litoralis]|uniref:RsmB/NOP family class I SAM-dependent RNA methyltransferase n=1 Tax=Altererythrobacter litoralis TaxID=3113904 RepID=A0ABU7GHL3_9SPHN|nr:RsmB/NOP family class I SAM-dependent RNA methyltransferase [Erythrobacteraceae bacterium 1XM1-14]